MTTQLLIYRSAVPVDRDRHATFSVEAGTNFSFSARINAVPLMAAEFAPAAADLTVVFTGTGDASTPVVILGVRDNENLMLDADGSWCGGYIPAFLRRYPFAFTQPDADRLVLCVDEEFSGLNTAGRGERLFDAAGNPTHYLDTMLNFLREFQAQSNLTQQLGQTLARLDVLEPMQADMTVASGARFSLSGFSAVNRDRLKALPAETLTRMIRDDQMELIYLHLHSLRNLDHLRTRLAARAG